MERYWNDYKVGDSFETSGRTMTDADIRLFIGATDATHPAHVDKEYAKQHPFGMIAVQGSLVLGVVDGLVVKHLIGMGVQVGHYGYNKIRFVGVVTPGDTIRLQAEVLELREKNDQFGLTVFGYKVLKQTDDLVAVIEDVQMIERRKV